MTKQRHIRHGDHLDDDDTVVIRGGDLDPDVVRAGALRYDEQVARAARRACARIDPVTACGDGSSANDEADSGTGRGTGTGTGTDTDTGDGGADVAGVRGGLVVKLEDPVVPFRGIVAEYRRARPAPDTDVFRFGGHAPTNHLRPSKGPIAVLVSI